MMFGSIESGKGTKVGERDSQRGLMGAFECIEPFDEQPLGNARGPGELPEARNRAAKKRIVEERDFRDAEGLAVCRPGSSPRHQRRKLRTPRQAGQRACGSRKPGVHSEVDSVCRSRSAVARIKGVEHGSPSGALSGVMRSQPSSEFSGIVQEFAQGLAWG